MKQEKRYSGSIIPDRFLYFKELFKQDEIHSHLNKNVYHISKYLFASSQLHI